MPPLLILNIWLLSNYVLKFLPGLTCVVLISVVLSCREKIICYFQIRWFRQQCKPLQSISEGCDRFQSVKMCGICSCLNIFDRLIAVDGTEVLMEIVGFWTPEYLAHKRNTLQQFRHHRILIAIPEKSRRKVSLTGLREGANVDEKVLLYKTVIKLKPLMEDMERIRHSSTCFIRHKVR